MADLDALRTLCDQANLPLIEDCAQSHGAVWRGRKAGTIGDIGVFSMHNGKPLSSGEGGAAITSDQRLASRMEQLRANGRRWLKSSPQIGHGALQEIGEVLGSNYAISEFQATILRDALQRLDEQNKVRASNANYLDQLLVKQGAWLPVERLPGVENPTYYHYLFRCRLERLSGRSLEAIAAALEAELGFWVHRIYAPLSKNPLYKPQTRKRSDINSEYWNAIDASRFELRNAEQAHAECLVFHHSVLLGSRDDIEAIGEAFEKVLQFSDRIPLL
jgi:dTDP-4-amino-4,6-dideoxygalactose transaminase